MLLIYVHQGYDAGSFAFPDDHKKLYFFKRDHHFSEDSIANNSENLHESMFIEQKFIKLSGFHRWEFFLDDFTQAV
jgi:hypothetical protein